MTPISASLPAAESRPANSLGYRRLAPVLSPDMLGRR
jgi:hypothetical protein